MQINFMKPRKIASMLSIIMILISLGSLTFRGLDLGLDFTGGTLIEIQLSKPTDLERIRDVLGLKLDDDFQVSYFGCLLYTSPSPRDRTRSRMPSSA